MVMHVGKQKSGFTIVELLIVVVVIAILAAITIVSYNGIQNRANDTVVRSDLANAARKVEAYKIDNGAYPIPVAPDDSTGVIAATFNGMKTSKGAYLMQQLTTESNTVNLIYCVDTAGTSYRLASWSKGSNSQGVMIGNDLALQPFNQAIAASSTICPALGIPAGSFVHIWLYDQVRAGGWRPFLR